MNNTIKFEDIKDDIVDIGICECTIIGSMYTNRALSVDDIVIKDNIEYRCTESHDDTSDEEREEGLSYNKIRLETIS